MEHWDEGVYMERGRGRPGATPLILSCGVHGDELAPVQVLQQLLDELKARTLPLARPCLLIFANLLALEEKRRYLKHNLNRLFGSSQRVPGYEGERVRTLEQHCRDFADMHGPGWHLDLHATIKPSRHPHFALQPYNPEPGSTPYDPRWPATLAQAGFTALVQQNAHAPTFANFSCNKLGYASFTLECGDIAGSGTSAAAPLDRLLRQLLTGPDLPGGNAHLQTYQVAVDLIKQTSDFQFLVDEKGENFATFPAGTPIARNGNSLVETPTDGCALLFANSQVPVGDRAGLLLAPTP
ncbi:MAG TPA: succinylglutamate desuccinylase [Dongiaceae bacterium]|nr:succinylglutamate desuccinylase [Dongiaceae bacterium]